MKHFWILNKADKYFLKMETLEIILNITIRILKISFRNCVSSSLSSTIGLFFLQAHFNPNQKFIGTPKFYCVNRKKIQVFSG